MAMLTWTRECDSWVSNGYRIELLEPYHWVLLRNDPGRADAQQPDREPLAETRTLSLCKRQAEVLDAASRLTRARRPLWAQLIIGLPAFALVPEMGPWGLVYSLALLVVVTRAIGFLAGTYMARTHDSVRNLTDQTGPVADDRLSLWPTRHLNRYRHG